MTAPSRPGLTYWRCPECGYRVYRVEVDEESIIDLAVAYEAVVEAHEARHGIGAA